MKILGRIIRTLALTALAIVALFNSFKPDTTPMTFNAEIASSSHSVIEDSSTN